LIGAGRDYFADIDLRPEISNRCACGELVTRLDAHRRVDGLAPGSGEAARVSVRARAACRVAVNVSMSQLPRTNKLMQS